MKRVRKVVIEVGQLTGAGRGLTLFVLDAESRQAVMRLYFTQEQAGGLLCGGTIRDVECEQWAADEEARTR